MERITVAHLLKPFGLRGEIHAYCMTDFPKDRFQKGRKFLAVNAARGQERELTLASFRMNGESLVLRFEEIQTPEEAALLQHSDLDMDKAEAPLPEGYFRYADLIGCQAVDEEGKPLGKVVGVTDYAPTKNLRVQKEDGKNFYVPFLDQFVPSIDLEAKRVVIHVIEGML